MALFRRIKSPRDPKDRHVTVTPIASEQEAKEKSLSAHRRHKSEEIIFSVDPAIFEGEPPELPPRNRETTSGSFSGRPVGSIASYRRTRSSGTMSANFKVSGHPPRKSQDDYFVPADTLKKIASASAVQGNLSTPHTIQDKRNMTMVEKIMSHNDPEFRASQKQQNRSKSFDKLIDTCDYSVPFDVLQDQETTTVIPPPKPKRHHTSHGRVKVTEETVHPPSQPPPNYSPPPPPPPDSFEEPTVDTESVSPHSPAVSRVGGDYDDPWDSKKFKKKMSRNRSDTEPLRVPQQPHIDPYKSPKSSQTALNHVQEEPPLPPKPSNHNEDSRATPSPPPPPVPETSRPRASTGESDYCDPPGEGEHNYTNQPLHANGGPLHEYVNQPAFPPQLPPRPQNKKKQHGYSPLVPTDMSHPPDIQSAPPAFPIDISIALEEQP